MEADERKMEDADLVSERLYIRKHELHLVLESLVGEALKERPADPLQFIAFKLMKMRNVPGIVEDVVREVIEKKIVTDDAAVATMRSVIAQEPTEEKPEAAGDAGDNASPPKSADAGSPKPKEGGASSTRKVVITARSCSVCGRDDRPGQQRTSGFKCHECVGIPSNPQFKKEIEEANKILKGRDEDGSFCLNEYRIIATLGQGAYGKVRLCMHNKSGQDYAIKFLSKKELCKKIQSGNPNLALDGLKKIREEIAIMKQLDHPNIIQIYGTMESETEIMIVMERLDGQIFPSTYPATPLPLRKLKKYVAGITQGLQFLHDKQIVHRDIKPDNILLDSKDNVKLADFGVSAFAVEREQGLMVTGFAGSPFFMPPETFDENENGIDGPATDVWSFGITLYAMAFGQLPPFEGGKLQDLVKSIKATEIVLDHDSPLINDLLSKMLAKDPAQRIGIHGIRNHEILRHVRVVKGQPVETIEVGLGYDVQAQQITLRDDERGEAEGRQLLDDFMKSSESYFQIIRGNPYEVTLYDLARDPRRQKKTTKDEDQSPMPEQSIIEDEWDDSEVDEDDY
eukprot:TRINITY_DN2181_c0_g1_i1.p1 TRINITY_DN2181_c0_g1~~TRINITY_DN2181_c0_g1_i1.p1  ORF type:complete len:569 (+),score=237.05 TRINITY_DN2181_c0_g1_i1:151-1857(+)